MSTPASCSTVSKVADETENDNRDWLAMVFAVSFVLGIGVLPLVSR